MTTPDDPALTKDDLRTLRRLATAHQHNLRRSSDTTADVLGAYDELIAKLDHALSAPPTTTTNTAHPIHGAMVTEYEVLDLLFEALSDTVEADLYDVRDDRPRPEFYLKVRGECWRVLAQPHPHPSDLGSCEVCIEDGIVPPNPATRVVQGPEGPYAACDRPDHASAQDSESSRVLPRASTAFERPAGNIFTVPDDGGSPLDDLSERPTILAPVEIADEDTEPTTQQEQTDD